MAIALVTVLPVGALGIATDLAYGEPEGAGRVFLAVALSVIPAILIIPISSVATTIATMDLLGGRPPTMSRSFEPVGLRFWPMAAALLIVAVGVAAGFVLLVVPGVFLLVLWLFAGQAAVIEGRGPRAALVRSAELVKGGWVPVFVTFLVVQVAAGVIQFLLGLPVAVATDGLDRAAGADDPAAAEVLVNGAWGIVTTVVIQPFPAVALALLYLDRRSRKEGAWPGPLRAPS